MTRDEIFARDGFRCVRVPLGRGRVHPAAALTLDPVQPRLRGGDRTAGNILTACGPCNVLAAPPQTVSGACRPTVYLDAHKLGTDENLDFLAAVSGGTAWHFHAACTRLDFAAKGSSYADGCPRA